MTDLTITNFDDAWIDSTRPGLNTGSAKWVQVKSGERLGLLRKPLSGVAGRTPLSAVLVGRVGPGHVGQTYTVEPVTESWRSGDVDYAGRPAVNAAAAVTETVSALPDKGLVEIDVLSIITSVAAGTPWYGLRIRTNSSTAGQKFYATDSGQPAWELLISLSDAPEEPSNQRPDGGGAVETGEPIVAWDFVDLGGESTEQAESQVQVDTPAVGVDPDEVSPDFDSGWEANTEPEYDLAASSYVSPGPGPTFWRARVKDAAGVESGWSDWAEFTVDALPSLIVDSPTGPFGDPSPNLLAHLSSGTVTAWKAFATGPNRSDVRVHTNIRTGAIDWTIPAKNKDGRRVFREDQDCWIYLRVWDDVDRAVAVGQKPYVDVWIPATFTDDDAVTAPTELTVSQFAVVDGDPRHEWSWERTEAADAYKVRVDGVTVARIDADEVTADGGVYSWVDSGEIPPLRDHTLEICALDNGSASLPATTGHAGHVVKDVWLLPEDEDLEPIHLAGTAVADFAKSDRVATYTPLVGSEVDVIYDYVGFTGSFEGSVDLRQEDVWATLDQIEALRLSRNRDARMVWGSQSIMVRVADIHATSSEDQNRHNLKHTVRFRFVQVGD